MSRDSGVTFEVIRRACYEILGRSERPSRPLVQELLATDRYIGRKGGNDLVQRLINDFWSSLAQTIQLPARTVDGIPDAFVSILDKALGDMVAVARQLARDELAEREADLQQKASQAEASVQDALDSARAADQLRIRAEGELSAVQTRVAELRASLSEAEQHLHEAAQTINEHQRTIDAKDAEIRLHATTAANAQRAHDQANEQHRQETHRLMVQIDNDRQAARKEAQKLTEQLEKSRAEETAIRESAAALREELATLRAEAASTTRSKTELEASLAATNIRLSETASSLARLQKDLTTAEARCEAAEQHRLEAVTLCTTQAAEIGQLRQAHEQLKEQLSKALTHCSKQQPTSLPGTGGAC